MLIDCHALYITHHLAPGPVIGQKKGCNRNNTNRRFIIEGIKVFCQFIEIESNLIFVTDKKPVLD